MLPLNYQNYPVFRNSFYGSNANNFDLTSCPDVFQLVFIIQGRKGEFRVRCRQVVVSTILDIIAHNPCCSLGERTTSQCDISCSERKSVFEQRFTLVFDANWMQNTYVNTHMHKYYILLYIYIYIYVCVCVCVFVCVYVSE